MLNRWHQYITGWVFGRVFGIMSSDGRLRSEVDGGRKYATAMSSAQIETPTARSVAWCSASDWSAPDRSGLLTLEASAIWTDPDGSRRIVWTINRMIKQVSQFGEPSRVERTIRP